MCVGPSSPFLAHVDEERESESKGDTLHEEGKTGPFVLRRRRWREARSSSRRSWRESLSFLRRASDQRASECFMRRRLLLHSGVVRVYQERLPAFANFIRWAVSFPFPPSLSSPKGGKRISMKELAALFAIPSTRAARKRTSPPPPPPSPSRRPSGRRRFLGP